MDPKDIADNGPVEIEDEGAPLLGGKATSAVSPVDRKTLLVVGAFTTIGLMFCIAIPALTSSANVTTSLMITETKLLMSEDEIQKPDFDTRKYRSVGLRR